MKKYSGMMVNKSYFVGLFFLTILFFGISGWPKSSWAADYYVDNTCAYSGNGTSQTCASGAGQPGPFNSLANAQSGLTGSQPDNRLLFKTGQTFTGQFVVRAYGTTGHPFTITSYGSGAKPVFNGGGASSTISITNLSNITIDGLSVTNGTQGVWIYRQSSGSVTNGIIVKNCSIYSNPSCGIAYYNEPGLARLDASTSEIYNNDLSGNCAGIYIMRVNSLKIHHNSCHDNYVSGTYEEYGIAVEGGSYNDIHDNMIYNNWINGIGVYGDSGSDGRADGNKLYRNVIYGTKYYSGTWARDIAWQAPDYVGSNNQIFNNICYSTDPYVEHFAADDNSSSATGNVLYGNTFANGKTGAFFNSGGAGWAVKNNIFYNNSSYNVSAFGANRLTVGNNLYYKSGGGALAGYNGVTYTSTNITALDASAKTTDPKFVGTSVSAWPDFRLQSGSPAIDAGANLGSSYSLAFDPDDIVWPPTAADQNNNGAGWEIGAFVYKSTIATPPDPPTDLRVVQ